MFFPGQNVQSRLLRERLAELEIEIDRFKKENAALSKLREENEKNQDILRSPPPPRLWSFLTRSDIYMKMFALFFFNHRRDRLEFEQMKAAELAKFEEYKKEEKGKLQKERRIFERHASAARAVPDKKEREEIQVRSQHA